MVTELEAAKNVIRSHEQQILRLTAERTALADTLRDLRRGITPDLDTSDCEFLRSKIDAALAGVQS